MGHILDKIILFFLCMLLNLSFSFTLFSILPILIILCITGYKYVYPKRKENFIFFFLYIGFTCIHLEFIYYLPILVYDWYAHKKFNLLYLCFLFPLVFHIHTQPITTIWISLSYTIAVILKYKAESEEQLQKVYRLQRDSTKELNLLMSQQNKDLIVRQDQEIHIATLNERNRIARDIHDNVGHLLSSSLLQMGAIEALNQQESLNEPILNIKDTLKSGLDSIRKDVHNMHHDAMDLEVEIQKLLNAFQTCDGSLVYDVANTLPQPYTYHIIAIIKEALHNIMKHANADKVMIICREQPMFYQLIIHDNGKNIHISENGIGLKNMKDRVEHMHGYFNYHIKDGFEIFITIPKEETR